MCRPCKAGVSYRALYTLASHRFPTCDPLTVCSAESQYEVAEATLTSDRTCKAATTCSGVEYETRPLTRDGDRKCTGISTCAQGERVGREATATADLACTPCGANTYMADKAHRNTACLEQVLCDTGEFIAKLGTRTKAACSTCPPGTCCFSVFYWENFSLQIISSNGSF